MKDEYRTLCNNSWEYYVNGRANYCFFDGHVESLAPANLLPPKGDPSYHFPLTQGDPTAFYADFR
jgi:prepilin-type processing-associated H-X9-DG protein